MCEFSGIYLRIVENWKLTNHSTLKGGIFLERPKIKWFSGILLTGKNPVDIFKTLRIF